MNGEQLHRSSSTGFSLIEVVIGVTVFAIIGLAIYQGYFAVNELVRLSQHKVFAAALGNEQLEIIRSLPYSRVGITGGLPAGAIPREQRLVRGGLTWTVITAIRNLDDPFDGTVGGNPADSSPADYKLAEVTVACAACRRLSPVTLTTQVAPSGLETASNNGALFIQVLDANGRPVEGAAVHVENPEADPPIRLDDVTNTEGMLQIIDAPPGAAAYAITVTKAGYSTNQTYAASQSNPNPAKPHATVAVGQVTLVSLAIDRVSTLSVSSVTDTCKKVNNVGFTLEGFKLIGTDPDVLKYSVEHSTGGGGEESIANLEWDTYRVTPTTHDLQGAIPLVPFLLPPDTTQELKLVAVDRAPRSLLVTVKDAATQLPLADAAVTLEQGGAVTTQTTGVGAFEQTDWSGGAGQEEFADATKYFADDGNIDVGPPGPGGELELRKVSGRYRSSGWLESSTLDTGSASNFHQALLAPTDQPAGVGPDGVRLQIATKKSGTGGPWTFFGPDGSPDTYYTFVDTDIHQKHDGDRYLKYRVYLQTADPGFTPNVSDIAITFTSDCVPSGQALFQNLGSQDATLTVQRTGYSSFTDVVSISEPWQQREILLNPQ